MGVFLNRCITLMVADLYRYKWSSCRSQWLRGLRHVLSMTTRTLGSQVRILLGAWMCVRIFLCCVVLCR
jgi:hypothetical protein